MQISLEDTVKARLTPLKGAVVLWVKDEWPDLTNRQLALLMIVCIEPGQHHFRHLAVRLAVAKPIVCRILDRLTELGLILREHDRRDRRNVFVVPTPRAVEFLTAFDRFFTPEANQ